MLNVLFNCYYTNTNFLFNKLLLMINQIQAYSLYSVFNLGSSLLRMNQKSNVIIYCFVYYIYC